MALYGSVKGIAEDKTLTVEIDGNRTKGVATLFGYEPVMQETVLLVGLESGGYVALGAVYNRVKENSS